MFIDSDYGFILFHAKDSQMCSGVRYPVNVTMKVMVMMMTNETMLEMNMATINKWNIDRRLVGTGRPNGNGLWNGRNYEILQIQECANEIPVGHVGAATTQCWIGGLNLKQKDVGAATLLGWLVSTREACQKGATRIDGMNRITSFAKITVEESRSGGVLGRHGGKC